MIKLPSKITEDSWFYKDEKYRKQVEPYLGRYYISYSSSSSWQNPQYRPQFIRQKFMGYPYTENEYSALGNFVGESVQFGEIQPNDYDFQGVENIAKIERPEGAEYERMVILDFGDYVFIGFIDCYTEKDNVANVLDYKTGGKGKEKEYKKASYTQVVLYAYSLEQEGKKIGDTGVLFLERSGSHINPPLKLTDKQVKIPLEYNKRRVNYALNKLQQSVFEISETYKVYLKYFG